MIRVRRALLEVHVAWAANHVSWLHHQTPGRRAPTGVCMLQGHSLDAAVQYEVSLPQ